MNMMGEGGDPPGTWTGDGTPQFTPRQRRAAIAAAAVLVLAGVVTLHDFLPALGWAGIFAIALWPWYQRICMRWPRHRRMMLPLLTTLGVALAFVLPLVMVVVPLLHDAHDMLQYLDAARVNGVPPPSFLADLPFGDRLVPLWQDQLGHPGALNALALHGANGQGGFHGGKVVGAIAHRILLIGFMLLALFFLLRDGARIVAGIAIGSRRAFGPAGEHVGAQIVQAIRGTVNGLVVVGFGEGVILGIAYGIAGVAHAALLALLTAILSAVPFGSVAAFLVAAGLLAIKGATVAAVVIVVVGAIVVFVADHFVRPVLIGGATRLPFVLVLLGILGGIEAFGLIGLVLGPAVMAALVLLWREWIGSQRGPINPAAFEATRP